ncbi:MAG: Na+/H+ antiporter subunit E [Nitrospirales bacterium]
MVHPISLGIALYLLWVVLSGYFQPLLLVLGVVSTLIVLFIALRMEVVDRESHPVHLTLRLPLYWLWLLWEIAKSNVVVARLIWSPSLPISPTVFQVPTSQKSQLGQVVYANSITLTPGTVSMTLENNQVRVHALTEDIAEDLQTGTMDRRVTALEGES